MADLQVDMDYAIMTVNSQIMYKPTNQREDPEPDNDHEVYVGNLPLHYTIEKFVNFAKKSGSIYSVRLLKGGGGLNKGFGYIMYRHLGAVDIVIETFNGTFLAESDTNKPLIVQKSLRNTIMMIYGVSQKNNNKYFIKSEISYFVINHPSLLLKFECEDDTKLFLSFKSLKAAQIFKKKLKDSFNMYGAKMYYFNDTENWERWEDLKKNISINPQGNRVRFIPIVPNNANRVNALPPTSSRSLLFKPFIPKHITNCPSKENNNLTHHTNDKENMTGNHMEIPLYPAKLNTKNHKSVSLQFSHSLQEMNKCNMSSSFEEKYNMNALENSLPKLPLRTIWTNDNCSKDFRSTFPSKDNVFRKPFSSGLNCLSQTIQSTNYVLKSKFQNKTQVLANPSNSVNNSRYFKSSYSLPTSPGHKLYPITENMNTSFFTTDIKKSFSAASHDSDTFEQTNSFSYTNQPFNTNDIWKNYQCQLPRM